MSGRRFSAARPDFARCRTLRHAWEVTGETEDNGSKLIVLTCMSCGTHRYDRWNTRTGARWGKATYSWPPEYKDTEPGHDPDWWRVTFAEHLFAQGILTEPPAADTRPRAEEEGVTPADRPAAFGVLLFIAAVIPFLWWLAYAVAAIVRDRPVVTGSYKAKRSCDRLQVVRSPNPHHCRRRHGQSDSRRLP